MRGWNRPDGHVEVRLQQEGHLELHPQGERRGQAGEAQVEDLQLGGPQRGVQHRPGPGVPLLELADGDVGDAARAR